MTRRRRRPRRPRRAAGSGSGGGPTTSWRPCAPRPWYHHLGATTAAITALALTEIHLRIVIACGAAADTGGAKQVKIDYQQEGAADSPVRRRRGRACRAPGSSDSDSDPVSSESESDGETETDSDSGSGSHHSPGRRRR
jgi:hypothetical protein